MTVGIDIGGRDHAVARCREGEAAAKAARHAHRNGAGADDRLGDVIAEPDALDETAGIVG